MGTPQSAVDEVLLAILRDKEEHQGRKREEKGMTTAKQRKINALNLRFAMKGDDHADAQKGALMFSYASMHAH